MNKLFTDEAWKDYIYWHETDKKQLKKINDLTKEIDRMPFEGTGKPEDLKTKLTRIFGHEESIMNTGLCIK